ncbi:MAG TPA: hypothetical protein VEW08_17235 [Steroidobacteraceae bacterium]|nr:hypothetical protein [Steroidobacteraceae bacterium]
MYRKFPLLVVALTLPSAASAQIVFPPSALLPTPVLSTPAAGATVKGEVPALTTVRFAWVEYGLFSTPSQPLPTHFLVCVKLASQAANCTFGPADFLPVGALPHVTVYDGSLAIGYRYTYDMPAGSIADSLLNVDTNWAVGACRNAVAANCVFSAPRPLWMSTLDLNAQNIADDSSSTHAIFRAQTRNGGSTNLASIPPVETSIFAWDAVKDPVTSQCRTDIDSPDVRNDPDIIVIMDNGATRWIQTLPIINGVRTAPVLVVGMHRWNKGLTVRGEEDFLQYDLPPGGISQNATTLSFELPKAQRPKPFVVTMTADRNGAVKEFDENNNSGAACESVP